MRKKVVKGLSMLAVVTLLFSGCGTELYELSDSEEDMIVHYAAYVLAKHNTYQKDGMTPDVWEEETEETDTESQPEPTEEETQQQVQENQDADTAPSSNDTQSANTVPECTLAQAMGIPDLNISYQGKIVEQTYGSSSYYALTAPAGYSYLVMKLSIANPGSEKATIDNLNQDAQFFVEVQGKKIASEQTILLNDFSSLQSTLEAGASEDTVLLFKVTDEQSKNLENVPLFVTVNNVESRIKL